MPRPKRHQVPPTEEWAQLRLFVRSPEQKLYEALRPIVLFGRSPVVRARETGLAERTLRRKADAFDQRGMASLFAQLPGAPPGPHEDDRRALPARMRQLVVDLAAEHAALNLYEIATICSIRFGRRPSHHTVKRILAEGRKPSRTTRRYPLYEQMSDPEERRLAVIRLHAEGWNAKSIAAYLHTTRTRVHEILRRWVEEGVRGLADKSRAPKAPARKVTLRALAVVRRLQANPELGEFRIQAALEQLGIHLSARTCGRLLALNRKLYGLPGPSTMTTPRPPREKKAMPFAAQRRHQYWTTDIRYIDHPTLGRAYVISILENFSRALLASVLSPRQDLTSYLIVLRTAVSQHGAPEVLVSDSGTVFRAKQARRICAGLGIHKEEIERGRPWQSYIETHFNVQRRMADWTYAQAQTWPELRAAHDRFAADYNYQRHFAHERREDGKHSPAAVLGWVHGVWCDERELDHLFRLRADRRVDQAGYVRFRRWRVYGERGLAGRTAAVWLFGETLTLEYAEEALSQYRVEFEPDDEHFRAISEPRLFAHRFPSAQPLLWELGEADWHQVLRLPPYQPRRKPKAAAATGEQARLFPDWA
jgi:putative transposase